jgi:hypothetical protein
MKRKISYFAYGLLFDKNINDSMIFAVQRGHGWLITKSKNDLAENSAKTVSD